MEAAKVCIRCGIEKNLESFYKRGRGELQRRSECKTCLQPIHAEWRKKNQAKIKEAGRIYRDTNREEYRQIQRDHKRGKRELILEAYGRKCACCGETEQRFLTIDHIHGGGGAHNRLRGNSGVYRDVIAAGFPKDIYQLLCYNCNMGRSANGGTCPHQQQLKKAG